MNVQNIESTTHSIPGEFSPIHSASRIIIIKAPTTVKDVIPYILVFIVYMIMVQVILSFWKKFHEKSYNIFVLNSILVTLPALCILAGRYLSLFIFLIYISFISYLAFKALTFSSNKNAPRVIFKSFKIIFVITSHATVISQLFLIFCFFFLPEYILPSLLAACYFIYYAVLSREIVRNLCYLMASSTGFYSKDGIPGRQDPRSECMICTKSLSNTGNNSEEKAITLKCGHSFHEDCLKGWCLIGQNNSCFYCKDGVDKNTFNQEYWIKSEVMISSMMSTMKSAISFLTIIFVLFIFKSRNEE